MSLVGINGESSSVNTLGSARGDIIINGFKMNAIFQVVNKKVVLNGDGLLGMDFLNKYEASINIICTSKRITKPQEK